MNTTSRVMAQNVVSKAHSFTSFSLGNTEAVRFQATQFTQEVCITAARTLVVTMSLRLNKKMTRRIVMI